MVSDLAKFDQFRVLGSASANVAADKARPNADYIVEGELVGKADVLRAVLRLVNTASGAQVWSNTIEEQVRGEDALAGVDRIAGRAAAIIGSWQGRIAFDQYPMIVAKPLASLSSYECIVQGVLLAQRPLPESAVRARTCLESMVVREPTNADAWSALAAVYSVQRLSGLGLSSDETGSMQKRAHLVDRMVEAASRAVALAPNRSFAHRTLGLAYAANCDLDHLREEARKAIELNPNDPMNYGILGTNIVALGDLDEGAAMVQNAISILGSDAPRWWYGAIAQRHFARGEYQEAYAAALKGYYERSMQSYIFMAAVLSGLDRTDAARAEIQKLLKMQPGYTLRDADDYSRAFCTPDERRGRWLALLRKAGLPE